MCINVDGQLASDLIIGAVGQENWEVEIKGRASHAGVAPEKGISATLVGAIALAEAQRAGWFGKVVKPDGRGTSNVGIFGGKDGKPAGDATNVVTDYAFIKGEARSPEAAFATQIAEGYKEAFAKAKAQVKDHEGDTAEVTFSHKAAYPPFKLDKDTPGREARHQGARDARHRADLPVLQWRARRQLARQARHPDRSPSAAGQAEIHTIKEYVNLAEYEKGCRLGMLMATLEE